MRTIIVINDNSAQVIHAAEAAFYIAETNKANLILANLVVVNEIKREKITVTPGNISTHEASEEQATDLAGHLQSLSPVHADFKPEIKSIDASNMQESELVDFINKQNTWMIIQGCGDLNTADAMPFINTYSLLNFIRCPLMFIPLSFKGKSFERMVYMADLRYCQPTVIKYATAMAKHHRANFLFAHLSASGLPNMEQDYAFSLFKESVGSAIKYEQVSFSNIKERNTDTALDVLIHGMKTDLLILVNQQYHFKEVLGKFMEAKQLPQSQIPVIVFPF